MFCGFFAGRLKIISPGVGFQHNFSPWYFLSLSTVFPRFSAPGRFPIFEIFGGALIKTYENLDLPFPAHTRTIFMIYDN